MKKTFFFIIFIIFITPFTAEANNFKEIQKIHNKYNIQGNDISIAILDTGIKKDNYATNVIEIKNFTNSSDYNDLDGHGTYIYSLIESEDFGIAPSANIYIGKVLNTAFEGKYEDVVEGITWAIHNEVDVILMSLGGQKHSKKLENAIIEATRNGVVVVSAAGNDGLSEKDTIKFPARFEQVISVGAINKKNTRWFNSSRGDKLDIMAPGVDIIGYDLNNEPIKMSGTSISAAYIAGLAVLMKEKNKSLSSTEIKEALIQSAKKNGDPFLYGEGIIQEDNALNYFKEDKNMFFIYLILFSLFFVIFFLLLYKSIKRS